MRIIEFFKGLWSKVVAFFQWFGTMLAWLQQKAATVWTWLRPLPGIIFAWLRHQMPGLISGWYQKLKVKFVTWLKQLPGRVWAWLRRLPGAFANWIRELPANTRKRLKESREAFRRVYRVAARFWKSDMRSRGAVLLAIALTLVAVNAGVNLGLVSAQEPYNTYMKTGPLTAFWAEVLLYAIWMIASTIVQACANMSRTALILTWRQQISSELMRLFASVRNFLKYKQDTNPTKPDNASQRMSQDPDTYAGNSVNLFFSGLDAAFAIIIFGHKLWLIYPPLIYWAVGNSVVSSLMVWLLGKSLGKMVNRQYSTEADLRSTLVEMETDAEAIALARGENFVRAKAEKSLGEVISILMSIGWLNFRLQLYNLLANQLLPIIPVMVVINLYLIQHKFDVGMLAVVAAAFTSVSQGLTYFSNQFAGIMTYFTVSKRIDDTYTTLEGYMSAPQPSGPHIEVVEGPVASFEHLTILDAAGQSLILDLTITFDRKTLITGPNGVGKGALLKALDDFQMSGTGKVTRLPHSDIMFLNQHTWMPKKGSLREALCFGLDQTPDDNALLAVLEKVKLSSLASMAKDAGGFDADNERLKNWRTELSSASIQQRLSLARVLIAKPKVVFIDQATVALEDENEDLFYKLLAEIGCMILSSATGASLATYHDQVLEILGPPVNGEKNWAFYPDAKLYKTPSWKLAPSAVAVAQAPVGVA